MKEKLERYYDYIVNDLLSTTKVDEENRTIRLPFPPYVKLNPYDGSDKPCLLYTSPSPRDRTRSRMPSSA